MKRSPERAPRWRWALGLACLLGASFLGACRQDMHDQPRFEPMEGSTFFADGRSTRLRVPGTIARGEREWDAHLLEGRVAGELAETFPMEVTAGVLARGRERYDVFCSACHDRAGTGEGIVVKRGLKQPRASTSNACARLPRATSST